MEEADLLWQPLKEKKKPKGKKEEDTTSVTSNYECIFLSIKKISKKEVPLNIWL